uniref:Uncharacterized protein n=1 Tax=Physcomitrium patens TaxID=3218 RepID=A0A2K1KMG0_PHYPA|nr:hypothetical protein PHYPA_005861 [Physcomitrium patens]
MACSQVMATNPSNTLQQPTPDTCISLSLPSVPTHLYPRSPCCMLMLLHTHIGCASSGIFRRKLSSSWVLQGCSLRATWFDCSLRESS